MISKIMRTFYSFIFYDGRKSPIYAAADRIKHIYKFSRNLKPVFIYALDSEGYLRIVIIILFSILIVILVIEIRHSVTIKKNIELYVGRLHQIFIKKTNLTYFSPPYG